MKRLAILIAFLTIAVVGCSSSGYDFQPDVSNDETEGTQPLTGCGVVQYWESNGWSTKTYGVGHVCVVDTSTTTTTEGN